MYVPLTRLITFLRNLKRMSPEIIRNVNRNTRSVVWSRSMDNDEERRSSSANF